MEWDQLEADTTPCIGLKQAVSGELRARRGAYFGGGEGGQALLQRGRLAPQRLQLARVRGGARGQLRALARQRAYLGALPLRHLGQLRRQRLLLLIRQPGRQRRRHAWETIQILLQRDQESEGRTRLHVWCCQARANLASCGRGLQRVPQLRSLGARARCSLAQRSRLRAALLPVTIRAEVNFTRLISFQAKPFCAPKA